MESFGDKLYDILTTTNNFIFFQGEMAQLTYTSYDMLVASTNESESEEFTFNYPIGYRADGSVMTSSIKYSKQDLLTRIQYLAYTKSPLDNVYQLVTIIEAMFNDILRNVFIAYPRKLSKERKFDVSLILDSTSLEEVKLGIVDKVINELAYKSPLDFAKEFDSITSVNLLEQPIYHQYVELKATRDIHLHNNGVANQIYLNKAGVLARVRPGERLKVDNIYFLKGYETCISLIEFLERRLHDVWPSEDYIASQQVPPERPEVPKANSSFKEAEFEEE